MSGLQLRTIIVAISATGAVACSADAVDFDRLPVGAEVAVAKRDGGQVNGTLTERTDSAVRINVGADTRTLPKDSIAAVAVVKDDQPAPVLNEARYLEYTIPAGTVVVATLETGVHSAKNSEGDRISARVAEPVTIDDAVVIPADSTLTGQVTTATASGKVKGVAALELMFSTLTVPGHEMPYTIAADVSAKADRTRGDDAAKVGAPTVGGAVIGGILGGKKGAVIGGIVGAGAGTAVVLTTAGEEVEIKPGTQLRLRLDAPVDVRVPVQRLGTTP
jgi:hypothetical protein